MSIRTLLRMAVCLTLLVGCRDATGPRTVELSLRLEPDSARVALPGDTVRLRASLRDASGNVASNVALRWSSSDTTVAVVSSDGLVRAVSYGRTNVTVAADTLTARAEVVVGERGVTNWSISRAPAATGAPLTDVWAAPDGTTFAVGGAGTVIRSGATTWQALSTGTAEDLSGVHGTTSTNVYAVSFQGSVFRHDGAGWSRAHSGEKRRLAAVWVAPTGEVFAVGSDHRNGGSRGLVVQGNAKGWAESVFEDGGTWIDLRGVWGTSANNVYAVGQYASGGIVFHYDGTAWRRVELWRDLGTGPVIYTLNDISGTSAGDVWAVGDESTILHFDGTRWNLVQSPIRIYARSVWGTSPTDIHMTGYSSTVGSTVVLHYDGSRLAQMEMPRPLVGSDFTGTAVSASVGYMVGRDGTVLRGARSAWQTVQHGPELADVHAASERSAVAVGSSVTALVYDGSGWSQAEPPPFRLDLTTVASRAEGEFFVANRNGTVYRFNGNTWTILREKWNFPLVESWASPDGHLYFVENSYHGFFRDTPPSWGRSVLQYDGASFRTVWTSERSPSPVALHGIWGRSPGEIYAVGSGGLIVRDDGSAWAPVESGTTRDLHGVWGAGGAVFAVGEGGTILRQHEGRWSAVESGTTATLRDIWGSSESNFYAVGDGGIILRFDGRRWSRVESGTSVRLNAVSGTATGVVFIAGERGVIVAGR